MLWVIYSVQSQRKKIVKPEAEYNPGFCWEWEMAQDIIRGLWGLRTSKNSWGWLWPRKGWGFCNLDMQSQTKPKRRRKQLQARYSIKDLGWLTLRKRRHGASLVVQRLRLCAYDAGGTASISGHGTKIPHATRPKNKKRQKAQEDGSYDVYNPLQH